ncbi:hypothetical protein [Nonomuraea candida]|uniref:hypothetical protein n=1 Tax=Nonomuraea candida TaxID=359159 RepID=UPI0005BD945D|nr:hypothetical protein [Nonomuraea candida]
MSGPRAYSRYHYLHRPGGVDEIGIALAGGGVRAACLALGALQVAEESGVLARARYVSAVSGGSYMATAFLSARALAARARRRPGQEDGGPPWNGGPAEEEGSPPWSRGSAEEEHLRRNLRYLGEDVSDLFLGLTRYVLSLLLNLVPFATVIVLAGCALGALYRAAHALAPVDDELAARMAEQRWALAAAVAVAGVLLERRFGRAERRARWAVLGLVGVLLLPDAVVLATRVLDTRMFDASAGVRLAGLVALLAVVAGAVVRTQWSFAFNPVRQVLLQVLRALFSISMVAVLVLPLLLAVGQASQLPYATAAAVGGGALLVLLVFQLVAPANRTSLHETYLRRLNRAYVVRAAGEHGVVRLSDVPLEHMHAEGLPRLLVCASVNLRASESAEGEGCASFVFSADYVGSAAIDERAPGTGSPNGGDPAEKGPPAFDGKLRAATLVAASGAAVAPHMGRYTGRATRIALALINLRLGLWFRNPAIKPREYRGPRPLRRLVRRWQQPGPVSTWREALGGLSARHRYLFVSDGGHWDNSGVVELLRRRCRTIFAVDASVDEYRLGNVLRLIALARTELGVEFEADGLLLESHDPVVRIRFAYPDDTPDSPSGYLILLRTHINQEMPSDIVALATDRTGFPRHNTLNQFLRARDVDAYVTLGRWLFQHGLAAADLLPAHAHHAGGGLQNAGRTY